MLKALWKKLVEPSKWVQESDRARVQLLTSLMLVLIPLGLLGILVPIIFNPSKLQEQRPLLVFIFFIAILLTVIYLFSQTKYYRSSMILLLVISHIAILVAAYLDSTPQDVHSLYYLLIIILASIQFLPHNLAILWIIITFLSMILSPLFLNGVTVRDIWIGPFNLVLLSTMVFLITTRYRHRLEQTQQMQLSCLLQAEKAAREQAERLQAATNAVNSSLVLQEVLSLILSELRKVVPYDSATVQQLKNDQLEIVGGHGFPDIDSLLGVTFDLLQHDNPNREVIQRQMPVILKDAPKKYDAFHKPPHAQANIRSWLGVPLLFGTRVIGMLAIDMKKVGVYNDAHAVVVNAFAAQAATAIENARLYELEQQRTFELATLAQISASLRIADTVAEMLSILLEKTVSAVDASFSVLFLVEEKTGDLISRISFPDDYYQTGLRLSPKQGVTGHVATTNKIYFSEDVINDPHFRPLPGEEKSLKNTQCSVSLPLHTSERLIGVLHIAFTKQYRLTEANRRLLTAVSDIAANALNRAIVTETLETHIEERTRELAKANERLKELDHLKNKFIADISHEIRTPVTALNLYVDLLERGKEENQGRYLTVLRNKSDQLVRLTEDILTFQRLRLYEENSQFTAVDLNNILSSLLTIHKEHATTANLQLIPSLAPNIPLIHAEYNQLIQAINNLLTNAIRFTPTGSITIKTSWVNNADTVCMTIQDTGIGINADDMLHLFERFYRGQSISQLSLPGTGLGLSIVKEIVDLHDGTISVKSVIGEGSVFTIQWPIYLDTEQGSLLHTS